MESTTFNDPVFGLLTWDRIEHKWLGRARLDELLDFGSAIPDSPDGLIDDDFDPQKLFKEGAFRLVVRPGGGAAKQPPTDEQRHAWQRFLESRERIIEDIMQRAFAAYVRQRPARIYWWETMYGADDPLLPAALPEVRNVHELRGLVRPYRFMILQSSPSEPPATTTTPTPAWVMIHFDAAWDRSEGFAARVVDGEIVAFGSKGIAEQPHRPDPVIDVPPFGPLRCYKGRHWNGTVHFEPFARMQRMADERDGFAHFRNDPVFRPPPDWNFIEANFDLEMISPQEGEVAPQQIEAFTSFMRDPQRSANVVLQAIFEQYQGYVDRLHDEEPELAERIMPRIDSPAALSDLITFQSIVISTPNDGDDDPPFIGLGFACSWDEEHGLYVRWRAGKVEEVGGVETIM